MRKICFVTSSRADYGLLKPLISMFKKNNEVDLQLLVTGSHLSETLGYTINEIINDGFHINKRIPILSSDHSEHGICVSSSKALEGISDALRELRPNLMVLLGDRYEILSAAFAATIHKIPIAHLHGGEITQGAMDESFRHAITKMSHLHFTSTEVYKNRVIQLGEQPDKVWNYGAIGVENALNVPVIDKKRLFYDLNLPQNKKIILVTYHPETLGEISASDQIQEVLNALENIKGVYILFTKANADTSGNVVNSIIERFVQDHTSHTNVYASLGYLRYLNLLKHCTLVVGNSSSGVLEVPSFNIPTVNIGSRQKGRIRGKSVIDVDCQSKAIEDVLNGVLRTAPDFESENALNPYEQENTCQKIYATIMDQIKSGIAIQKTFYDTLDQ